MKPLEKDLLIKSLRRSMKATAWPKDEPDHAIGSMVNSGKKRNGKKKAARRK